MRSPIPPPPRKGRCSMCDRLSPAELEEARRLRFSEGWGYLRLAKRFGSSRSTMHRHFIGNHNDASRPFEYSVREELKKAKRRSEQSR